MQFSILAPDISAKWITQLFRAVCRVWQDCCRCIFYWVRKVRKYTSSSWRFVKAAKCSFPGYLRGRCGDRYGFAASASFGPSKKYHYKTRLLNIYESIPFQKIHPRTHTHSEKPREKISPAFIIVGLTRVILNIRITICGRLILSQETKDTPLRDTKMMLAHKTHFFPLLHVCMYQNINEYF